MSTHVDDTFAEAFPMSFARLLVTALDAYWLDAALREFCGYASSVIACDAEVGVDTQVDAEHTTDGRPGAYVLVFGFSEKAVGKAIANRVGQCLMTCPTTAVYNGWTDAEARVPMGKHLRFFGDGFQRSKMLAGRRYWRVPVMDGDFVVEDYVGVGQGVGGGNLIVQARQQADALSAACRAVAAIADIEGVITPFPGGIARSGSKVGSIYPGMVASTADAYCPTLRSRVESKLHADVNFAYEVVIDGIDEATVARAMRAGLAAAQDPSLLAISAGNYGGKLGKYQFHLRELASPVMGQKPVA